MAGLLYPCTAACLPEVVGPAAALAIMLIRGAPRPALEAAVRDVLTPQWNVWISHWVTKVTTQNTLKPFLLATEARQPPGVEGLSPTTRLWILPTTIRAGTGTCPTDT